MELSTVDLAKLKSEGRNFNCESCPQKIQKLRRCHEDREDFNESDGSVWPIYLQKGGQGYGFCPAKATWDCEAVNLFRLLQLSAETGKLYEDGGLAKQPAWFIEQASWFIPRYKDMKIYGYARSIIGDGSQKAVPGRGLGRGNNQR